jgi:CheY-like chemotaxis protein
MANLTNLTNRPTILIADDDQALVQALKVRLEREGYEILTASDGYGALAKAVAHRPDLMVLDIHMPAGSGFTVQERKDRNEALTDVPVIYITGDHGPDVAKTASACNAAGLVLKPFDTEALLELIVRTVPCPAT